MSNEVRSFKMISGDEVITRVDNEDGVTLDFVKPLSIAQVNTGKNQVQLALIPYCASNPEAVLRGVQKSSILAEITPVNKELEAGYIQQTSGIVLQH